MYVSLLGRQASLSLAELQRQLNSVTQISESAATFESAVTPDVRRLGGSQKLGRVSLELRGRDWRTLSMKLVSHYTKALSGQQGKITIGLSVYDLSVDARDVQKTALILKSKLKASGHSVRLIPNQTAALSTATSHHNKLGLSSTKIEIMVFASPTGVVIADSIGAQDITSLSARDQGRPKRDAFVGMLPPKLAQILVNLAGLPDSDVPKTVLDPFCGTGVVLQESLLLGFDAYGTDLAEKMIRYSRENLDWLANTQTIGGSVRLEEGDAMTTIWQQPIDAVVCEAYLGQPFSAPPSPAKLTEVRGNCQYIIGSFLTNLSAQLASGTPVVVAVPAWKRTDGSFVRLPLTDTPEKFGFRKVAFSALESDDLLYFRPDQVVARDILVLEKL